MNIIICLVLEVTLGQLLTVSVNKYTDSTDGSSDAVLELRSLVVLTKLILVNQKDLYKV